GRRSLELLSSQAADAGRGRLAGGVLARAERGADVRVAEVVAVAEHDGGTLGRRQLRGEVLELGVGGTAVAVRGLLADCGRLAPPVNVDRDPLGDRVRPRAELAPVLQAAVRAQGAQERLLERVLRLRTPEPPAEEGEDLPAQRLVEALEG